MVRFIVRSGHVPARRKLSIVSLSCRRSAGTSLTRRSVTTKRLPHASPVHHKARHRRAALLERARRAWRFLPLCAGYYTPQTPMPLVVALHGRSGNWTRLSVDLARVPQPWRDRDFADCDREHLGAAGPRHRHAEPVAHDRARVCNLEHRSPAPVAHGHERWGYLQLASPDSGNGPPVRILRRSRPRSIRCWYRSPNRNVCADFPYASRTVLSTGCSRSRWRAGRAFSIEGGRGAVTFVGLEDLSHTYPREQNRKFSAGYSPS